jgi:hypothetical protein
MSQHAADRYHRTEPQNGNLKSVVIDTVESAATARMSPWAKLITHHTEDQIEPQSHQRIAAAEPDPAVQQFRIFSCTMCSMNGLSQK